MLFWLEAMIDSPEPVVCVKCREKFSPPFHWMKGTAMRVQLQYTPTLESKSGSEPPEITIRQVLCKQCWQKQRVRG